MVALSVRGEASRLLPPDAAELSARVALTRGSAPEALRAVAGAADALVRDLSAAGGQALTAGTARAALTWSRWSASTQPHWDDEGRRTPRTTAAVELRVVVRALDRLEAVGALLARHEALELHGVQWHVDDDNPAWPGVRAEAVAAAVQKARDYAAALGGELLEVEHVADVGLLGGREARAVGVQFMSAEAAGPAAPSLDPVPQELAAAVEARFSASARPL